MGARGAPWGCRACTPFSLKGPKPRFPEVRSRPPHPLPTASLQDCRQVTAPVSLSLLICPVGTVVRTGLCQQT